MGVSYHNDSSAFKKFHNGHARDSDRAATRPRTTQVHRAFNLPRVDQVNDVIAVNVQDASQDMHGETIPFRQILSDAHGEKPITPYPRSAMIFTMLYPLFGKVRILLLG